MPLFHELTQQKECKILEGHTVQDPMHMLIAIPPKYSVAQIVEYIKGKSTIAVAHQFGGENRILTGEHFWARGYVVSTAEYGEEKIRNYIQNQEQLDKASSSFAERVFF